MNERVTKIFTNIHLSKKEEQQLLEMIEDPAKVNLIERIIALNKEELDILSNLINEKNIKLYK